MAEQIDDNNWAIAKVEYESSLKRLLEYTGLRRQGIAFSTTFQAAILSIIGSDILDINISHMLLSIVAFFVLFMGLNNERRLYSYIQGCSDRIKEIENQFDMSFFKSCDRRASEKPMLFSNNSLFQIYYALFIIMWIAIWIINITNR